MSDLFEPTGDARCKALLALARETNARRDRDERRAGFAAPPDATLDLHLRNAISAVIAGIEGRDWDCVAEGLAMVQDCESRARTHAPAKVADDDGPNCDPDDEDEPPF